LDGANVNALDVSKVTNLDTHIAGLGYLVHAEIPLDAIYSLSL
jgi:hypothetical protein